MFSRLSAFATALAISVTMAASPAAAADQVYFSKDTNVTDILVNYINHETVRLDVSSWYLSEHSISIAIANRFHAGVPVRLIGDRGALFEADPHTKAEFYWLASQGVPIRLRFNPTWFPEIDHWKMALFVGQNTVEFGSGNFAPTELAPNSPTNYDDESELFTSDPDIVNAFRTKFDQIWNDTMVEPQSIVSGPPYLKDWNDACAHEPTGNCADYATLYPNPAPMIVNTARLEPDYPMPADIIWGQGSQMNNRLIQEINAETVKVDFVAYRLEVPNLMQALLDKFNSGVAVRLVVDKNQYTNILWPEYWLTHAYIDKLWAAGVPIIQNNHDGVTHEKTIITSTYTLNGSSNWGANWQRDHNYFIARSLKPAIWQAFQDNFNEMWNDTTNYGPLVTTPPRTVDLSQAGTVPASGQSGVSPTTTFTWNRAAWATSYDIWLGTTSANMTLVATVQAQLVQDPPLTYSWTPPAPLNFGTNYVWKVVSRTFANMTTSSGTVTFSTPASGSQPPTAPASPSPANGTAAVGTSPALTWTSAGATSYAINFGTTNPPPSTGTSTSSPSYSPGTLASNTTYFWQIIAMNGAGSTAGPIWTFATSASNLPAPWQSQDVGATGQTGSSIFGSGTYTIRGAGADIWGTADAFQFGYQPLTGDGQIVARITAVQNTNSLAKAGLMLRESAAANAAHVLIDLRPTGDIEFMSRSTTGGSTTWIAGSTQALPAWLKLVRTGSTVTGFKSADGSTWTQVGTATITLPSTANAGLVVSSHTTSALNTSTFDSVAVTPAGGGSVPGTPTSPSPANSATGVNPSPTLTWSSSGATTYDVAFGTSNPPPSITAGQSAASYSPGTLPTGTTFFWQIAAHNSVGDTNGPIWSFTTAASLPPPGTPTNPAPASGATGVSTAPTLTWSASGATTYDVKFGTSNPPASVTTGQSGASYTTPPLANSTTYFWQIIANNGTGSTAGPIWSFATQAAAVTDNVVVYAADIPSGNFHGSFSTASDATAAAGVAAVSADNGVANTTAPLASPVHYVDVPFEAPAGTAYTFWIRLKALGNSKLNDSLYVQFSDARSSGSPIYPMNSTSGLVINLATDSGASSLSNWGWVNGAYWLTQPATVTFASSATHTLRIQVREDGFQFDQIVLSPSQFFNAAASCPTSCAGAPGPVNNDSTIVPKPAPPSPPGSPASASPGDTATGVSTSPTLTWTASGATSFDVAFGTVNPPPAVSSGQASASYSPSALANTTTYFWRITAINSAGSTVGPVWSFTTAAPPPPPAAPGSPSPANTATGVSTSPTLTWSAGNATAYTVKFGATNPPPTVSSGQAAASFSPSALSGNTTYFWQIVATNSSGSTAGPVWSFTTAATVTPTDIVIYASDIAAGGFHGSWTTAADATAAAGVTATTSDTGFAQTAGPLASPTHYVDVTFSANGGVAYTFWMRLKAIANSKYNDSLFVQFSDALASGSPIYPLNTTQGLAVNLATDTTGSSLSNWGWVNGAYWLSQPATLTFASSGTHTLRIQVREDGVEFDQLVLSPSNYFNASASCPAACAGAPGPVNNDATIVAKP
jgi:PLD-like domain